MQIKFTYTAHETFLPSTLTSTNSSILQTDIQRLASRTTESSRGKERHVDLSLSQFITRVSPWLGKKEEGQQNYSNNREDPTSHAGPCHSDVMWALCAHKSSANLTHVNQLDEWDDDGDGRTHILNMWGKVTALHFYPEATLLCSGDLKQKQTQPTSPDIFFPIKFKRKQARQIMVKQSRGHSECQGTGRCNSLQKQFNWFSRSQDMLIPF